MTLIRRKINGTALLSSAILFVLIAAAPSPAQSVPAPPKLPPIVNLLPESFPDEKGLKDIVVEGLPLPLGGPLRIAFSCAHPDGLGKARLMVRVIKKPESGNEVAKLPDFRPFELGEGKAKGLGLSDQKLAELGEFDFTRGFFKNDPGGTVFFYKTADGVRGGGRFSYLTKNMIPNDKGEFRTSPKKGDWIEFYIEVFPFNAGASGKSEIRFKEVVTHEEFMGTLIDILNEEQRLRDLGPIDKLFPPGKRKKPDGN